VDQWTATILQVSILDCRPLTGIETAFVTLLPPQSASQRQVYSLSETHRGNLWIFLQKVYEIESLQENDIGFFLTLVHPRIQKSYP
jgi:hypothetical protein